MIHMDKQQQQQQHLLQLDNFYLTAEELQNSPSRLSGVSTEEERQLRIYGCEIIQVPLLHSMALLHLSACCSVHWIRVGVALMVTMHVWQLKSTICLVQALQLHPPAAGGHELHFHCVRFTYMPHQQAARLCMQNTTCTLQGSACVLP